MHTITDITRVLADLEDAASEHRKATEGRRAAEQLLQDAHEDAVAAEDTLEETRKELLALCGALVLQHANPCHRHTRFVIFATLPHGSRDLVLDTADEAKARAEQQRLEALLPASDPCIMRRVYVQLDTTVLPAAPAPAERQNPTTETREETA